MLGEKMLRAWQVMKLMTLSLALLLFMSVNAGAAGRKELPTKPGEKKLLAKSILQTGDAQGYSSFQLKMLMKDLSPAEKSQMQKLIAKSSSRLAIKRGASLGEAATVSPRTPVEKPVPGSLPSVVQPIEKQPSAQQARKSSLPPPPAAPKTGKNSSRKR